MDGPAADPGAYVFGQFLLDPVGRTLKRDGVSVPLPARLFDTLLYLVENSGRIVERDELVRAVWPGRVVEEGNLAKAISSLRTALRSGGETESVIVTAHGRGYRFGAAVHRARPVPSYEVTDITDAASTPVSNLALHKLWGLGTARATSLLASCAILLCALLWLVLPIRAGHEGAGHEGAGHEGAGHEGGDRGGTQAPFAPPPRSVAVLPFSHADAADEQFSDGVSEELINALGRVGALRVAGRMSSFSFKGRQTGIGEIARQLNVATVLEGSVRRDGAKLRIAAQLIDATTGYQLWSQEYNRDRGDLLPLEQQIAEAVIASLKIVLAGKDAGLLTLGGTNDPGAFDAYLAGMAGLTRADADTNAPALAAFDEAIARDPHYALAYAQRARALAYRAETGAALDLAAEHAMLAMARRDAEKAVALAPDLGAAHAALALVLRFGLSEFGRAQAELERAITLAPGDVAVLMDYAFFEIDLGHFDTAVAAAERAAALDPLTAKTYKKLAELLAVARHFDEAFVALRRAGTLRPADQDGQRLYLSFIEEFQGDAAGAARTCAGGQDFHYLTCLAWAYQKLGRQAEAEAALARLHALVGDDGAYAYARIAAVWGRREEALRWLRTAYDLRDSGLSAIRIDPFIDTLRTSPEYQHIEQALGFPP